LRRITAVPADSTRAGAACYDPRMRKASSKKSSARHWLVSIIGKRSEFLGTVEAPDEKSAELAAAEQFGLDAWQRKRLVLREVA
jgi:hypothetical protein